MEAATALEQKIGDAGPSVWWRIGLVVLAMLVAVLLVLQMRGGNTGTDVIPGTPVAAPQAAPPTP